MQFLQILKLVLGMLPMIIEAIKAVEEAIPGNGKGEQKLALIRATMESAYGISTDAVGKFEEVWPAVAKVVGTLVATFNALGIFKK